MYTIPYKWCVFSLGKSCVIDVVELCCSVQVGNTGLLWLRLESPAHSLVQPVLPQHLTLCDHSHAL